MLFSFSILCRCLSEVRPAKPAFITALAHFLFVIITSCDKWRLDSKVVVWHRYFCMCSKKYINGFSVSAKSILNTSIKTKRPAKKSNVAHSTRCKMISKSWMSARTKSQSAPRMAIQPEKENKKHHLTFIFIARKLSQKKYFIVLSNRD